MKKILLLGTTAMMLLVSVSCKKKKDPPPAPTVIGYWVGKYGNGSDAATLDYAFVFKSDGTVKVYANNADTSRATKGDGTYTISGTRITSTYVYPGNLRYSAIGTVDANFKIMTGTWGNGTVSTGNTFFLNKQ
jgi:hypothetical protein